MIIKTLKAIKENVESLPEKGMVWMSKHSPDKEGRKALFVLIAAIMVIALIAKEIHGSRVEEKEISVISDYVQSTLESPKSDKIFEIQGKDVSFTTFPKLDSNGYQYKLKGIRRFENCDVIIKAIGKGVREHQNKALLRLDRGSLYPALISSAWNEDDIKNLSAMACEIVHQNKTTLMFEVNYPTKSY